MSSNNELQILKFEEFKLKEAEKEDPFNLKIKQDLATNILAQIKILADNLSNSEFPQSLNETNLNLH